MRDKLTDLTNEVRELKAVVAGKIKPEEMQTDKALPDTSPIFDESDFVSTHQNSNDPTDNHKLFYPNVGLIGALVGSAVMAVVGFSGAGEHVLHHIIGDVALTHTALNTGLIASGAALGGSFGVSRDIFRKIFDVTDCWFLGVAHGQCSNKDIAQAKGKEFVPLAPKSKPNIMDQYSLDPNVIPSAQHGAGTPSPEITNVFIAEPQSTYFRDKISKQDAQLALLSMDHHNAVRH